VTIPDGCLVRELIRGPTAIVKGELPHGMLYRGQREFQQARSADGADTHGSDDARNNAVRSVVAWLHEAMSMQSSAASGPAPGRVVVLGPRIALADGASSEIIGQQQEGPSEQQQDRR